MEYPFISDKLDNLLLKIFSLQEFDGKMIDLTKLWKDEYWQQLGFKHDEEGVFYLETLIKLGLIRVGGRPNSIPYGKSVAMPYNVAMTFDGLKYAWEIQHAGANSNKCFVAMSFSVEHEFIYSEIIEPICKANKFEAIRVDRLHGESTQTINDLIVGTLKTCRFCIADFTGLRNGVYFEAGYAAGRGMKVIYTCNDLDFKNLHFDINHFQFIIWEEVEKFKQDLHNKIGAYILE